MSEPVYNIRQVIVVRRLYTDKNGQSKRLTNGKYGSQIAHASCAFLTEKWRNGLPQKVVGLDRAGNYVEEHVLVPEQLTYEQEEWIKGSFAKIVLCVDTEEELLKVYQDAVDAGLTTHLIKDFGATEFNFVPTYTTVGIGPHLADLIHPITKELKLF